RELEQAAAATTRPVTLLRVRSPAQANGVNRSTSGGARTPDLAGIFPTPAVSSRRPAEAAEARVEAPATAPRCATPVSRGCAFLWLPPASFLKARGPSVGCSCGCP